MNYTKLIFHTRRCRHPLPRPTPHMRRDGTHRHPRIPPPPPTLPLPHPSAPASESEGDGEDRYQHDGGGQEAPAEHQQGLVLQYLCAYGARLIPRTDRPAALRRVVPRETAALNDVSVGGDRGLWLGPVLGGGEEAEPGGMLVLKLPHVEALQVDSVELASCREEIIVTILMFCFNTLSKMYNYYVTLKGQLSN